MKRAFEISGGFTHFSEELLDGIKTRLKQGEQTLLFLNRRGYHRLQMCSSCSHIIKCPYCDLSLTFHREIHILQCHPCDYKLPIQLLPVMPAGHAKVKDIYRFQFLIKVPKVNSIAPYLKEIKATHIDVDPLSTYF